MVLNELGFQRPSYDEILEEQIARAKTLFGETIDTSELTALGKYIRINVADIDTLYQTLEGVYYARFPNTASGTSLDRLCPFAGITRNVATFAKHTIKIVGEPHTTIEAGFEVATKDMDIIFHTVDDKKLNENGEASATVECNEAGTVGNVSVGSISEILNPSANVESVTHTSVVSLGKDRETDTDLRKRFNLALSGAGNNSNDAIRGAVMRVESVEDCKIVENTTSNTVGNCSPYSFECVVKYDNSTSNKQLIGEAILSKKPVGVSTSGTSSATVKDNAGKTHYIKFTPAETIYVDVYYVIQIDDEFEADGEQQIAERVTNYINSLKIGEKLYSYKLYSCISITGVVNVSGLDIRCNSSSLPSLEYNQIFRTTKSNMHCTFSRT